MKRVIKQFLPALLISLLFVINSGGKFLVYSSTQEYVIEDNGSSNNEIVVTSQEQTNINQTNETSVANQVSTNSESGNNNINYSTSSEASIQTGNISEEVVVSNTNINQSLINNNCCDTTTTNATINGNSANSTNTINIQASSQTNINTNNTASINNNLDGYSNTGNNNIKYSLGDAEISTGNISSIAIIKNNSINVTNIEWGQGSTDTNLNIGNNGYGSYNVIDLMILDDVMIDTNFDLDLDNNLAWYLNTGKNSILGNLGDASIRTGDIDFDVYLENKDINFSHTDVSCCEKDVANPPDREDPEKPHENGKDKEEENGVGGNGGLITQVAAVTEGMGEILGLSVTSSGLTDNPLLFWTGLALLTLGLSTLGHELEKRGKLTFEPITK